MLIGLLLVVLELGCQRDDDWIDDAAEDAADWVVAAEAQADCVDFLDAAATLDARCLGADYDESYAAWIGDLGEDCCRVWKLRDLEEYRDQCVPWVESQADCDSWGEPGFELDSSCVGQFIYDPDRC